MAGFRHRLNGLFGSRSVGGEIHADFRYDIAECIGQGVRPYQEDSIRTWNKKKNMICALVADGMGGMQNGAECSQITAETFSKAFGRLSSTDSVPERLESFANAANTLVFQENEKLGVVGGTTLACVCIFGDGLWWISVGDSRIYLLRGDELVMLNSEHELENLLYTAYLTNNISFEDIAFFPSYELRKLTSNLGREKIPYFDQNFSALPLVSGDRILICSDGVSGTLTDDEIRECIRTGDAQECCRLLEDKIIEKNNEHQDNYSAALIICEAEAKNGTP